MDGSPEFTVSCPMLISDMPNVLLSHGGGGQMSRRLIESVFVPAFGNAMLEARHDGAAFTLGGARLAFTTDSYVVRPLFFPGGDIGMLAVNGTVNDLAMCGARPAYLSCGFILEEGLPISDLVRAVESMRRCAEGAGVQLVTGDTKVVDRGRGDGIYINTAGIGVIEHSLEIGPSQVRPGDAVILSGDIGRHGIAIMAQREGLEFETTIASDCAPVAAPALALIESGIEVHCLRDLTRGGLASALVEIADTARVIVRIEEDAIPVPEDVESACAILGLDPLYVANEGRFVAFVAAEQADAAVETLGAHPVSADARRIGTVAESGRGLVTLKTTFGVSRVVDMLSGEQLPRIC